MAKDKVEMVKHSRRKEYEGGVGLCNEGEKLSVRVLKTTLMKKANVSQSLQRRRDDKSPNERLLL